MIGMRCIVCFLVIQILVCGVGVDLLGKWYANVWEIGAQQHVREELCNVFTFSLGTLWTAGWKGACHDTSAALYMALKELEFNATLCIGVVDSRVGRFDHSWVEIDGFIFDMAVCLPAEGGRHVSPPVFASRNVETLLSTDLRYGFASRSDLDDAAELVAQLNLEGYANIRDSNQMDLWSMARHFGAVVDGGPDTEERDLKAKYGSHSRAFVFKS